MNISRINELLQENEKIRQKIVEIKRKINLKHYTYEQKLEFNKIIKMLKEIMYNNDQLCVRLSTIDAKDFAEIVKKVLNKNGFGSYTLTYYVIDFASQTLFADALERRSNIKNDIFLVVKNKTSAPMKKLSLNDLNNIPIARMNGYYDSKIADDYTKFIIDNKKVSIFEDVNFGEEWKNFYDIKTFNLGLPSAKNEFVNSDFKKLVKLIKDYLGIWQKEQVKRIEKQQ